MIGLGAGVVRFVIPRPPPPSVVSPPLASVLAPPLTRHVLFVIVDGLRYDIGTDPAVMPELSRRMKEHASAEIWAGPVSMTSSAILTFATGQRGDIEQIITNESGSKVAYKSVMDEALAAGLVTAGAGDRGWFRMFPDAWSMKHPDPYGVAIDVDYNEEIFAAVYDFLKRRPRPGLLIAHFVTTDHQAHAYGVLSDRYRVHMRGFDRSLAELLESLPLDTTVIVTSDHGMTNTGTHGSDTPLQRRSPFLAYGPGIAARLGERGAIRSIDQIDIPGTLATLLGVSAPAYSRGHVLVDWLDIPEEERARLACADLDRLSRYARAMSGRQALSETGAEEACAESATDHDVGGASARLRIERSARAAVMLDRALGRSAVAGLPLGWIVSLAVIGASVALALAALGGRSQPLPRAFASLACCMIALGAALTYSVELLPGAWPNTVRIAIYVLVHALLLAAIICPRASFAWLDRNAAISAALFPGLLVITPTRITQVESFVIASMIAIHSLMIGVPSVDRAPNSCLVVRLRRLSLRALSRLLSSLLPLHLQARRAVIGVLLLTALIPVGVREAGFLPAALTASPASITALALVSIALLGLDRGLRAERRGEANTYLSAGAGALLAGVSLLLRRTAPAPVCLTGWITLPLAAFLALRLGRRALAELLLLGSYTWVSRDAELPILVATLLGASLVGDAFGDALRDRPVRPSSVLLIVTFLFAWTFLQRVGIQQGLDFSHFDWGAGAFRQAGVSIGRVGAALAYKHGLARGAAVLAVLAALPEAYRMWVARGLFAVELMRVAMLTVVLHTCRGSYWTSLRAIGDLPHALLAVVIAALAMLLLACSAPRH